VKEIAAPGVTQVAGSDIEVVAVEETVAVAQTRPPTTALTVPAPLGTIGTTIETGFAGSRLPSARVPVPLAGTMTVEARGMPVLVNVTTALGVAHVAGSVSVVVAVGETVPAAPHGA